MEINVGRLVRNDHDHADLYTEQTDADDKQQRKGENIASLPQQEPPAVAVGVMQPSEGNGDGRCRNGHAPQYSDDRNEEQYDADRYDEQHGKPEFTSAGPAFEFQIPIEEPFDGVAERALMIRCPCAIPP